MNATQHIKAWVLLAAAMLTLAGVGQSFGAVTPPASVAVSGSGSSGGFEGTNTYFPNVMRRVSNYKPLRVGCFGDSIGFLTMEEFNAMLAPRYGRSGAALDGGNYFTVMNLNSTATNVTRYTNWYRSYWDLGAAGQLTCSNAFNLWTYGNLLGCEFLNQTNGGVFKLQLATNGGAFVDVLTGIATGTAGLNSGNSTNVGMLPGYYAARVLQTSGGLVSIIGVDLWDTNSTGIRVSYVNNAGSTIQDMANVPTNVSWPILNALSLDLILFEGTTDQPVSSAPAAFATLGTSIYGGLTNGVDGVWLGTTPVDPAFSFDFAGYNLAMRAQAVGGGQYFFDQSTVSGSFSNMQYRGWSGDGLHRSNNLSRLCASVLIQTMGLLQNYWDSSAAILSSTGMFTAPVLVSNRVSILGPNALFELGGTAADGASPNRVRIRSSGGILQMGIMAAGDTFEGYGMQWHAGYGGMPLPLTAGGALGHVDFSWGLVGTNIMDTSRHVVSGTGNGNTNYTLLAGSRRMWCGSSNVNILAAMNYQAGYVMPWTLYCTNLSAITWGFGVQSTTNRWRWRNGHTGGTNAPQFLTNNALLRLDAESFGTNTDVYWYSQAYP